MNARTKILFSALERIANTEDAAHVDENDNCRNCIGLIRTAEEALREFNEFTEIEDREVAP